jgi:lantibiotic leader peptide-processing serine protease
MKKYLAVVIGIILVLSSVSIYAIGSNPSDVAMTVVFNSNEITPAVREAVVKSGAEILVEIPELGAMQIRGRASLLNSLKKNSDISAVAPSIIFNIPKVEMVALEEEQTSVDTSAADLYNTYQWDIKRVTNNGESYELGIGSHDVVVGIIDTGVSKNHAALKANLLGGANYVPVGGTYGDDATETGDPQDYEDRHGHGSHVAGTIAGKGRILGVAPGVGYRAYRVFGATGGAYSSTIVAAMIGAVNDGVDVISMSLGGFDIKGQIWWTNPETGESFKLGNDVADNILYKRAVKYAVDNGVTVVAAAGNDAVNATNKKEATDMMNYEYGEYGYKFVGASFESPGNLTGVIAVSATGPDDSLSSYSNYGAGFINVTAPGGDFQRWPEAGWHLDMCLSAGDGMSYVFMAGTSMATPKVSAVAALIIAKHGKIGPQKVAQILYKSSEDIGKKGVDEYFGNGMVNAYNVLK